MNDTPEHIDKLQLQIWLSKSPMERLKQMMEDNAALYQFWRVLQQQNNGFSNNNPSPQTSSENIKP